MTWWAWLLASVGGYAVTGAGAYVAQVPFWCRERARWHRGRSCPPSCRCRSPLPTDETRELRVLEAARADGARLAGWLSLAWPGAVAFFAALGVAEVTWRAARAAWRPVSRLAHRGVDRRLTEARFDAEGKTEEARVAREEEQAAQAARDRVLADRAALAREVSRVERSDRYGNRYRPRDATVPYPAATARDAARQLVGSLDGQLGSVSDATRAEFFLALGEAARGAVPPGTTP